MCVPVDRRVCTSGQTCVYQWTDVCVPVDRRVCTSGQTLDRSYVISVSMFLFVLWIMDTIQDVLLFGLCYLGM